MIKENTALSMAEASEFVDKTSGAEIVAFIRKFSELKVEDAKKMRAKYRKLLSQVRNQISFLKKALHAKEIRSFS